MFNDKLHLRLGYFESFAANAENIGDALRESGTRFVDVNSGVESAPGVKDEGKLKAFVVALRQARTLRPV